MFMQMSPEMLNTVMNKIERFINSNVIPNATKFIGVLCGNLHGSNAQQALKRFIPLCANKIRFELESGASSISSSHSMSSTSKRSNNSTTYPFGFASMSDSTLHWYQCILWNGEMNSDLSKESIAFTHTNSLSLKSLGSV